ncbi:MAG: hypothetical protein ACXABG_03795 [Promethearchaeota archaeon]|jgi:hypothetical protein
MAQAEEKSARIDSNILFQDQASEVVGPQVLVTPTAAGEVESRSRKKGFKKLFYNARITEEINCINDVKAHLDARMLSYRNRLTNF